MSNLWYLACPYSHPDPVVQEARFEIANRVAATLMKGGLQVISPISHSHPIAKYGLPGDFAYWENWNKSLIDACCGLIVPNVPGFIASTGVRGEVLYANEKGKLVLYPNDLNERTLLGFAEALRELMRYTDLHFVWS